MSSVHRHAGQRLAQWNQWRRSAPLLHPASELQSRTFCSAPSEPDPLETHKKRLLLWFSHLPQEERQFGGGFCSESMHVDPLIVEGRGQEGAGLLSLCPQATPPSGRPTTVDRLFDSSDSWGDGRGTNVLLYGAVGTGKSTVFRKLVLDWCHGRTLTQFKLLLPFSCDDLSQQSKAASLRSLVNRKYLHLQNHPLLSGAGTRAQDVLFLFGGMEKMNLDFRIGSSELCSDPSEALPPSVVVVNLLRKYLLPEASVLVTTRLSALDLIPAKFVSRSAQICGFSDAERQRAYFASRLLRPSEGRSPDPEAAALVELLYQNLRRETQLAAACFLPSYCWLTCATLHFLHFTDARAPIRTLTGIYTGFLRLNFGGEVLGPRAGLGGAGAEQQSSLMSFVVRTLGKLAFDGVTRKQTAFSESELEEWMGGGKTRTDEELQRLAVFRTDVLDFFLAPCVETSGEAAAASEPGSEPDLERRRYVFAAPAMQEYLAALYVVLGENKSALEKLTGQMSATIGQAGEDVGALLAILAKFTPLRVLAVFNLLKLFPTLYAKIRSRNKGSIARTMAAEMFRTEDSYNEDVLDQVEQGLLGVHGPAPRQLAQAQPFELYPIFMGGLLHYGNRVLLQQLGCSIQSSTVVQITNALRKHLVRELSKVQPPEELMDLLVLLYEFQNPRLTSEVLASISKINLRDVRMTTLKCSILSAVLSCTPASYRLRELDLSSCLLTREQLQALLPAFRHTHNLNLQFNSLGPDSCVLLRDLLQDPLSALRSLQLCDNLLLDSGAGVLLEALPANRTLTYLSLMHTGLGDQGALQLAQSLHEHQGLQELNVAYNNIGDGAAQALVDACREHPSIHTLHLYLNPLSDAGKKSLYVRGTPPSGGRRVRVLASVTEGADVSEDWHPILSVIRENASSWDRQRVKQQLQVFLRDLEWGRRQQPSPWKRLHFRRVEQGVRQTLRMLDKDSPPSSPPNNK